MKSLIFSAGGSVHGPDLTRMPLSCPSDWAGTGWADTPVTIDKSLPVSTLPPTVGGIHPQRVERTT